MRCLRGVGYGTGCPEAWRCHHPHALPELYQQVCMGGLPYSHRTWPVCTTRTDDWCIKGGMHVTVTADNSYDSSIQMKTTLQYKFLSHATEGALDRHAHRWVDRNNTPIDDMGVRQSYNLGCSYVTVRYRDEVVVEETGVSTTRCLPGRTG